MEEGEGHGPRKEFFIACGSCMVLATQDRQGAAQSWQPPFVYKRSAGEHWLNVMLQETPDNRCLLWTTGWLMAQAICNRSTLGIPLPKLLFQILLQVPPLSCGFRASVGACVTQGLAVPQWS